MQTLNKSPKSEPALEHHSRVAPSVEAHHGVSGPYTGRNSRGRQKKQIGAIVFTIWLSGLGELTGAEITT